MAETVPSPCTGICRLDEATGFCLGCARTGDEIGRWGAAPPAEQRAILAGLPARWITLGRTPPPPRIRQRQRAVQGA
jgi:predicted Fe-S protein YdhL (DUF1289 family)